MVGHQDSTAAHRSSQSEQKITNQVWATTVFTVMEVSALLVVLVALHANGVARVALAVVLATGVIAIVDAWREPRVGRRTDR
jgi:hypothetical protein